MDTYHNKKTLTNETPNVPKRRPAMPPADIPPRSTTSKAEAELAVCEEVAREVIVAVPDPLALEDEPEPSVGVTDAAAATAEGVKVPPSTAV